MDFIDKIRELAARIPNKVEHIQTEEATKNALVLPFITALGYNVFDPTEVVPEFTADVGTKKGEKVDYAILMNGKPIILFECKWCGSDLEKEHASQLYRYFSVTDGRFGVLTNGIIYRFYSDLEKQNKMDDKPFFEFNMLDIDESLVEELKKFTKSSFNLDSILTTASELKYTKEIKKIIEEQTKDPSDEFVKFFASQVYSGRMTQPVREQFYQITKKALKQFINDKINERLKYALVEERVISEGEMIRNEPIEQIIIEKQPGEEIITTEEEYEGYYIVKTILRSFIDPKRVTIRDVKSYCNVLLDNNNRKPICRLYFNTSQKYLGLFDKNKNEQSVPINYIDDIYKYSDDLKCIVEYYDENFPAQELQGFRGTNVSSFELRGVKYEVDSWRNLLLKVCEIMQTSHKDEFEQVLSLTGRKRPYFTKDPDQLRSSERIKGTDIYVEINLSANTIVRLSKNIIILFGYNEEDLSVEIK
ncbi:hypothetical protein Mhar_1946 [Methanothrix harundinacea 6Ac]|uniref:Restriction endonuclease type I HsdR N-terminal domain-containing protein n=1 Tax=Methanothrix harundinacea (strain 6Ac) TaxID=1110509 RepID=G7WQZ9_METH6|nr:type I restriction endonuclease [Methanothrix harundinacea]AET65302.1 hypothetical protein Mhar_1946 [Methanothrix harundinacea 6Ac]